MLRRRASLSRRSTEASAARNALRDEEHASSGGGGESATSGGWSSALTVLSGQARRSRSDESNRASGQSEEAVWVGLRTLESLETVEELHCSRLAASYESLKLVVKAEVNEAANELAACTERLNKSVSSCRRSEALVRRCRASLAKAKDAATHTEAERLEAARVANEATAKAVRDIEALSRSRDDLEPGERRSRQPGLLAKATAATGTSSSSVTAAETARKASAAAERARSVERRCAERVKEAYMRVGRETNELRSSADAAIGAIRDKERCEVSVVEASLKIKRDFARPRALEALREIARYERGHLEAKLALLDELDAALDAANDERPTKPRPSSQRRRAPKVSRALELLHDCLVHDYYSKGDEPPPRGLDEDAIDAHVSALFLGVGEDDGKEQLPPLSAQRTTRADELRDAASLAGFDADAASRLAASVLATGPTVVAPPAARALLDFVADSRDRAAAVARALNRQRSKQTATASLEALEALAALVTRLVAVCTAAGDAHTPGIVLMLAQTFFVDGHQAPATAEDAERTRRTSRLYLKDKLGDDFVLRTDVRLWRACLDEAALSAVSSTTRHYPPYWDLVFTDKLSDVANDVHRCVHAQLAAFLFAMRDLGAPNRQVRKFAIDISADYQLTCRDRLALLAPYDDEQQDPYSQYEHPHVLPPPKVKPPPKSVPFDVEGGGAMSRTGARWAAPKADF